MPIESEPLRAAIAEHLAKPGVLSLIKSIGIGASEEFWGECNCGWKCQHTGHRSAAVATRCVNRHIAKKHDLE